MSIGKPQSKQICGEVSLIMHQMLRGTIPPAEAAKRMGVERNRLAIYQRFVKQHCRTILEKNFAVLHELLGRKVWDRLVDEYFLHHPFEDYELNANAAHFPRFLWEEKSRHGSGIGEFHLELAELEWKEFVVYSAIVKVPRPGEADEPVVNPTLIVLECVYPVAAFIHEWRQSDAGKKPPIPAPAEGMVLVYRDPQTELVRSAQATDELLLAIKVIHDKSNLAETADKVGVIQEQLEQFIAAAAKLGVICV